MSCPLCLSSNPQHFYQRTDNRYGSRDYYLCDECGLIFLDPAQHLCKDEEKARYDTHRNHSDDEGYVQFLKKLTDPLLEHLKKEWKGLDFGCGPGPTVSTILAEEGYGVADYDPFYKDDQSLLQGGYNFITSTEVFEHLHHPRKDIKTLSQLLKPGGVLGVMTSIIPKEQFADHWYHRDPAHVSFYQRETMEWIAQWQGWSMENPRENIILFLKPPK